MQALPPHIVAITTRAFRNSLWWIVGSNATTSGPAQFAALHGSTTLLALVVVFTMQTLRRSHAGLLPDLPLPSAINPRTWGNRVSPIPCGTNRPKPSQRPCSCPSSNRMRVC
jgi:hypothetical protein